MIYLDLSLDANFDSANHLKCIPPRLLKLAISFKKSFNKNVIKMSEAITSFIKDSKYLAKLKLSNLLFFES
jgi:hypothetical protein